jgi:glycosyltransferase involved in cell wall biosynthesis
MNDRESPLPKISVVVAVIDAVTCLKHCVESIIEQGYRQKEIIIIDGGSEDGTVDLIKSYAHKIDYWESKKDRGICHAWNKAIEKVSGDWVLFLGADDWLWAKDTLENVALRVSNAPQNQLLFYGNAIGVLADDTKVGPLAQPWSYRKFLRGGMLFSHQGVLHSKELFRKYGCFDESLKIAGDYEFLLRVVRDSPPIYLQDIIITGVSLTGMSHEDDNSLLLYEEYVKAQRKNGLHSPLNLKWCLFKSWVKQLLLRKVNVRLMSSLLMFYRKATGRHKNWPGD